MTKKECENYISDIPKFAGKNTNEDTYKILEKLVDINELPPVIHVAGTNGKGSVCAFIQSILMEAGLKTGMFISPHLVDMNERIMIDHKLIDDDQFVWAFEQVKSVIDSSNHPSFFEYLFLMCMVYFAKEKPDYIILETGLGGRLDATNCLHEKVLCVITEIGFDHMQYLGDTIDKIAFEKAGIIKNGAEVAFADKRSEATKVIKAKCLETGCEYRMLSKNDVKLDSYSGNGLTFALQTKDEVLEKIQVKSKALYQCENAGLSINGLMLLGDERITKEAIYAGIQKMYWPGRMEEIDKGVFVDGAHNEDGVMAMTQSANAMPGKKHLLFAVVNDKDYQKMIDIIVASKAFEDVIVTKAGEDRATDTNMIADIFLESIKTHGSNMLVSCHDNIMDAYKKCIESKGQDIMMISGSLYLVGDIKRMLGK